MKLHEYQSKPLFAESGSDIERELYRQPKLVELRDITQKDDKEREGAAHDLNRAAQG